jgi:hypothetical protein
MTIRTLWELTICVCLAGQLSLEAYWQRLRRGRSPFSPTFDYPLRKLRRAPIDGRTLSQARFLRPTRDADCDAPEVIALAAELRASAPDDWHYAAAILDYVRNRIDYCFDLPPRRGVVETLERGFGTCNDKLNLLVALARAGGIPARYCTLGIAPGRAGVLSLMRDDEGVFGMLSVVYRRFLTEDNDPRAKRIASLVLRLLSRSRRSFKARARDANRDPSKDSPLAHYVAELQIGSDWIPADPTLSDADNVALSQRFGDAPFVLQKVVGMTINGRMEEIPPPPRRYVFWLVYSCIGRGFLDCINDSRNRRRLQGRRVLAERDRERISLAQPRTDRPMLAVTEERA